MRPIERATVKIDGRSYELDVHRRTRGPSTEVSVAIPSFNALGLTRSALDSIRTFAPDRCEIWVIDSDSIDGSREYLLDQEDVNVVVIRTPPPSQLGDPGRLRRARSLLRRALGRSLGVGSYAVGVAYEVAARYVTTRYLFLMHNDSLVCDRNWLPFAISKFDEQVRGVALIADSARAYAMHCSGFFFDLRLVRGLGLDLMPDLPDYDTADGVTLALRRHGYSYYVCANTFNRPETVEWIGAGHPLSELVCDRVFDDEKRLIYAHLGRGTLKYAGRYTQSGKTRADQWIAFAESWISAHGAGRA